jgi:hypothetical protein
MKKIIRLTESDLVKIVKRVIKEQRISDLPQNQQTGPKPNVTSNTKDLRGNLSPQQQQQYKDITKGQKDLSKDYYTDKEESKSDNYKISDHTLRTVLSIGASFIPVIGPFVAVGISLYDAADYYSEGDTKNAGLTTMLAFLPGAASLFKKIPGIQQLGEKGMKILSDKLVKNIPLNKVEKEVMDGIVANKDLVTQELSKITANTAKNAIGSTTKTSVKEKLIDISKQGLNFTKKKVAPSAATQYGYNKTYDYLNTQP